MSPTLEDLKHAASGLSAKERAERAQYLLRSLDSSSEEWLALAEQRMTEVRSGKVVGIPAEEVRDLLYSGQ